MKAGPSFASRMALVATARMVLALVLVCDTLESFQSIQSFCTAIRIEGSGFKYAMPETYGSAIHFDDAIGTRLVDRGNL